MLPMRALMTNMSAAVCGKAATAIAGMLTLALLTRGLGPEAFGHYRTALTFAAFASAVADLGLYLVTLRELARGVADSAHVLGSAFTLRLVSSAIVLLAAGALVWTLPYDPRVQHGMVFAALTYVCMQGSELLVAVFQRTLRQGLSTAAQVAGAVTTLGCVALLCTRGAGVVAMLAATALGSALTLGSSWALARRVMPFRLRIEPREWRGYVASGWPMAGSLLFGMAMLRGDTLLLSLLATPAEVGLYGVPAKIFELTTSLPYLLGGLMMASFAAALAQDELARVLGRVIRIVSIAGATGVIAISALAPQLLALIAGDEFAAGGDALVLLACAALMSAWSSLLRFALLSLDRSRALLAVDAAACAAAFLAYLVLIPRLSIEGAALGTCVGEASVLAGLLWVFRKQCGSLPSCAGAVRAALAGALALLLMSVLSHGSWHWIGVLAAGITLYAALVALFARIHARSSARAPAAS